MAQKISGMTLASGGNLTGAAAIETTDSLVNTVKTTFALLRTALFAGGTGYAGSDPLTVGGALTLSPAASTVIPGATSFSIRNTANSADNLIITDAGVVTTRIQSASVNSLVTGDININTATTQTLNLGGTTCLQRAGSGALTIATNAQGIALTPANGITLVGNSAAGTSEALTVVGTGYGAGVASLRLNGLSTAAVSNQVGTLTNAPVAGNPAFWMPVSIAGTVRYIPAW